MTYELEKKVAVEAVTRAAKLCMAVQADIAKVASLEKDDRSPVTIADFGAQALVCQHVIATFPDAVIVGEEDSAQLREAKNEDKLKKVTSYVQRFVPEATTQDICRWIDAGNGQVKDRFWTLDPIDGTKGFLRNDQYATALALIEDGQVQVAALACPALPLSLKDPNSETGAIFFAVRGEGAYMASLDSQEFSAIQVVEATNTDNLRFVESVESAHGNHSLQQSIATAAGFVRPSLRMDSQAKYGAVSRGDAALYLRLPSSKSPGYREKIWDHAAGSLITEEAGGRVTDMHGRPLDFASNYKMDNNWGVVVSNGVIHEAVLEALAEVQQTNSE